MRVLYAPQRSDDRIDYTFSDDTITVRMGEVEDVFDFSALPDGELDVSLLETTLPICPIVSARRVNGQLEVTLLRFHGPDAPDSERFPEPEVIQ